MASDGGREIRVTTATQLNLMINAATTFGYPPNQISVIVLRDLNRTIPHLLIDEGRDELHERGVIEVTAILSLLGEGGRRHTYEHIVVPLGMWKTLKVARRERSGDLMRQLAEVMTEASRRIKRGVSDDAPWD